MPRRPGLHALLSSPWHQGPVWAGWFVRVRAATWGLRTECSSENYRFSSGIRGLPLALLAQCSGHLRKLAKATVNCRPCHRSGVQGRACSGHPGHRVAGRRPRQPGVSLVSPQPLLPPSASPPPTPCAELTCAGAELTCADTGLAAPLPSAQLPSAPNRLWNTTKMSTGPAVRNHIEDENN